MATVIKAGGPIRVGDGMSFNLEDITDRANARLDKVRIQAAEIIARAQQEGEAIRRQAQTDGQQAAMRAAEQAMEAKVGQQLATLLPAIQRMTAQLEQARQAWLAHWERSAVHLATRIAERIIRREVARQPQITATLVREALEMAIGSDQVAVHMHPTDIEALGPHLDTLLREVGGKAQAKVVPDATFATGGCRIETRFGAIDQRIEEQLRRIEEELV